MKTIRACFVILLLAALPQVLSAAPSTKSAAKTYRVSKTYTTLSFTATKWMVFKEEGTFQDYGGTLTYDPVNPSASSIDVTVQAASLDTRNSTRDGVLRSDDFFDVAKYPTLSFRSTRVTPAGSDSLSVAGDLTIHGVTKQVTVPVNIVGARVMPGIGDFAGFETTFTIDRREFGVLGTRWSGNTVAIDPEVVIHLIIGGVRE
ncbi:MAG: YceI family protein [Candidatus Acidiferrales bacterium]